MIRVLTRHIVTPLGGNLAANWEALLAGQSALRRYEGNASLPEPYVASKFDDRTPLPGHTLFETWVVRALRDALAQTAVDTASPRTLFILSSTKGNISLLETDPATEAALLPVAAANIARSVGFTSEPLVVSNACISGVAAQVIAMRLLQAGSCDTAVIAGADVQDRFIISGFQSFKALAPEPCRPFDAARQGLNAGEAVAVMVLQNVPDNEVAETDWVLLRGAVRNDANHISGPSRTGEGSYQALQSILEDVNTEALAFVNAHGTATPYNDEMEAKAITRAGLQNVPVNGYKGYYGHTMGAAGLLETILSQQAVDCHTVVGTRGFETAGVSLPLRLSAAHHPTGRQAFVKLLSGFGGCNAAVLWARKGAIPELLPRGMEPKPGLPRLREIATFSLSDTSLTELYRNCVGDYPKFYKMDPLCRLGFIASELLLRKAARSGQEPAPAVILFSRAGSLCDDLRYQATIKPDSFFPSPAIFVYTLPNIVTGEICIRNGWNTESSMFLLPRKDWNRMLSVVRAAMMDAHASRVLCGWVDAPDEDRFEADLRLLQKDFFDYTDFSD